MTKKRKILTVLIIFISVCLYHFQVDAQGNKGAAEITFEKTIYDYGTIKKGGDGNCEFVLKNTGKSPLIITNCSSSCGCTVPQCSKEPIKKGEKRTILIKYNTKRLGSFTKTITVYSNAKNSPTKLTIKGKVVSDKAKKAKT